MPWNRGQRKNVRYRCNKRFHFGFISKQKDETLFAFFFLVCKSNARVHAIFCCCSKRIADTIYIVFDEHYRRRFTQKKCHCCGQYGPFHCPTKRNKTQFKQVNVARFLLPCKSKSAAYIISMINDQIIVRGFSKNFDILWVINDIYDYCLRIDVRCLGYCNVWRWETDSYVFICVCVRRAQHRLHIACWWYGIWKDFLEIMPKLLLD